MRRSVLALSLPISLVAASMACSGDSDPDRPLADQRCIRGFESGDTYFQNYEFACYAGDCDNGTFCDGFETCQGEELRDVETKRTLLCTCSPGVRPCAPDERCDEERDECIPRCDFPPDEDNDGVWSIRCGGIDCDDNDPSRYGGNLEVCDTDGFDEDCDPSTVGFADDDGDGYIDADCFNDVDGDITRGTDCDDGEPAVNPFQPEVCNGVDDDCDGDVDEGLAVPLFVDADNDGFGVGEPVMMGCGDPADFAVVGGDCDDTLATLFPDAIRCDQANAQSYELCLDNGSWQSNLCPNQRTCYPQPDGTGVCLD